MRIVVTGGAGFIGSHLVERLIEQHDVVVVDDLSTGYRDRVPDAATFHELDVRETDALTDIVYGADRVYHLAAHTDVRESADDHMIDYDLNVDGTKSVLEAVRRAAVDDLVFASTSTVYGEAEPDAFPLPEDYSPKEPISHYGATKLAGESLISAYSHLFGIDATVLRLANIVGQRAGKGVVHDFATKLRDDPSELEVLGDGSQKKSYLHVESCVDAFVDLPDACDGFSVFNIGADDAITVTEIAETVIAELAPDADITYTGGRKGWDGDVPAFLLSIETAKQAGWTPSVDSETSVRRAIPR